MEINIERENLKEWACNTDVVDAVRILKMYDEQAARIEELEKTLAKKQTTIDEMYNFMFDFSFYFRNEFSQKITLDSELADLLD